MGSDEKTFKDSLETAISNMMANYNKLAKYAARYAAKKACDRIQSKAIECLHQYYNNYQPRSYTRNTSDPIIRSFIPFQKIKPAKVTGPDGEQYSGFVVTAGIQYDTSMLTMYHSEHGAYNPVDGIFVFDNFMNGWHPGTDGSKKKYPHANEWKKSVKKYGQIDPPSASANIIMQKYLYEYTNKFKYFDKDFQWYLLQMI